MKYLSKVVAFMLAIGMVLSMGSFAAVSAEYTDIDTAENPDSLKLLSALNVMNGYTDGTVRPEGQITRAEVAKMIYVIKMGGKDDGAAYYKGVNTSLTDINGHWAEGYVKYCYSTGIIAGRDDNRFDPDANVTGVELAKMLLVVQGYNASKVGLVGAGWSNKVVELAAENEYFKGYNTLLNGASTREGAATIMANALDATIVTWSEDSNAYIKYDANRDTKKISEKYFGLKKYEGVVTGAGEAAMVAGDGGDGIITVDVEKIDGDLLNGNVKTDFEYDLDVSELLGQYVVVTAGSNKEVYGIYASSSKNTVVNTAMGSIELVLNENNGNAFEGKIKINGKQYKVNANASIYVGEVKQNNTVARFFSEDEIFDAATVRFIDNTGDGKFDVVSIIPVLGIYEVTAVTKTTFTAGSTYAYDDDDVETSTTFKKGDYVVKTMNYFTDAVKFELATVVEGKITAITRETNGDIVELDNSKELKIYNSANSPIAAVGSNCGASESRTIGSTQKFVTVNNISYYNEIVSNADSSELAFVTETGLLITGSTYNVKLLFSTGKTSVVEAKLKAGTTIGQYQNELVSYEVNGDGEYEIEIVSAENIPDGYNDATTISAGYDADNKRVAGKIIDANAVVFVKYVNDDGDDKYTVITGSDLLDFSNNFVARGIALSTNSGVKAATVITLVSGNNMPGAKSGNGLAIVTGAASLVKIENTRYYKLPVWTLDGSAIIYVTTATYSSKNLVKGKAFTYTLDATSDYDIARDVDLLDKFGAIYYINDDTAAINEYDGSDVTLKIASDVQVLNVETTSSKITGVNSSEIYEAGSYRQSGADNYYNNAYYMVDGDEIVYVVVDVNGEWKF